MPPPAQLPVSAVVPAASGLTAQLPLILALALAAGAEAFTSSAVGLALPHIGGSLGASPDEISWAVTLYLAGYAVGLPLSAWLPDLLGQRRYLGLSMAAYLLTSLGCLASPTLPVFLMMRTLQGAAGAGFIARAIFTFTKEFRPPVLFRVFYIFIGAFGLRAIGLPLGGWLVDQHSWRWVFAVPVLVLGFGALPALARSPEVWPRRREARPDFAGLLLLIGGMGALLVGLLRGQRDDWFGSPVIVALATTVLLAGPLFFWRQHRSIHRRPVFTLASLRYRGMGVGVTLSFLVGLMLVGGIYVLPQFLLRIAGCDATRAGWILSVDGFAMMAGLYLAVAIFSRKLTRLLLTLSGLLFAAAMLLLAGRVTSATPVGALYLPMALHGVAVGFALPPIGIFSFRAIGANHGHNAEGRAWHYTARHLGGVVAMALVVLVLDLRTTVHSSQLTANLTDVSPLAQQTVAALGRGLAGRGLDPALGREAAAYVFGGIVSRESTVLAFRDLFLMATAGGVVVSLLSFGLPKIALPAPESS